MLALNLIDSPTGRALRAIHDSEVASRVLGVDVARKKLAIFVISAIYASVAGSYLALFNGHITPDISGFLRSIELVAMVVLGGMGSIVGSLVGAAVLVLLPQTLTVLHDYEHMVLGLDPDGLHDLPAAGHRAEPCCRVRGAADVTILEAERLSIAFGGVRAIDEVSLAVEAGLVFSIIGPNGAGKTTLFNMFSGLYVPQDGRVRFAGEDVTGLAPDRLARRGLSRTFQNLQIFFRMTALENVMVGRHRHETTGILSDLLHLPSVGAAEPRAPARRRSAALARVGLDDRGRPSGRRAPLWRLEAPRDRARARERAEGAAARRAGRRLQSGRDAGARGRHPVDRARTASRSCWSSTTCGWS